MEIQVAHVENQNHPGAAAAAARAEPDVQSKLGVACCLAFMACTVLAACAGLVVLFCRSAHASTALRVLAVLGLVGGIVGLAFGAWCCGGAVLMCILGNFDGTRQVEAPRVAA